MSATVEVDIYTGSGPTNGTAEGGVTWGRDDNRVCTANWPIPTVTGTFFTFAKTFALLVTGGTLTNHITNRRALLSATPPTGVNFYWQKATSYSQALTPASVDSSIDDATPIGYSGGSQVGGTISTTPSLWDNTSVITAATQNGSFVRVAGGVDSTYGGGGGSTSLGNLILEYDEGP